MMIDDISDLLALCAQFDGRTISDETPHAWLMLLEDIPAEDAAAAVREHYRTDRRWIMPADIVAHHQKLAAGRAVEQVRQHPPACPGKGCGVRYRLSARPGSTFAYPDDGHAAGCEAVPGGGPALLVFDDRGPSWSVMPYPDPAGFDEVAWEAGAARVAGQMARYREIMGGDPSYGPDGRGSAWRREREGNWEIEGGR